MPVTFDKLVGQPFLHIHKEADLGGPYVNTGGDVMTGNLAMSLNEITSFKIENVSDLPMAGNAGRIVYLESDGHLYLDTI
jgi:hypothetical protein